MIDANHVFAISANIHHVWEYVQDIQRWSELFPGCESCEIIDQNQSRWKLKVGAGGMLKSVHLLVKIEERSAPDHVSFTFELESEPVTGSGSFNATPNSDRETGVSLSLTVEGRGQMAPMWEAMSKPLLPQMASSFAERLRSEIESTTMPVASTEKIPASVFTTCLNWFRNVWWALLGSPTEKLSRLDGNLAREAHNKSVVLTFVEAMSTSNPELAESCLASNAFSVAKGYGKFAGVRQRDVMVGTIDAFAKLLPTGLQLEVKSVIASGNTVAVELEGDGRTFQGTPYRNQYCMVYMLEDGKICQVNEYFCTVHADEVLWPLVDDGSLSASSNN